LHTLYQLNEPEINHKIDAVMQYVLMDEFHDKIDVGCGIVFHTDKSFHGVGWDVSINLPNWASAQNPCRPGEARFPASDFQDSGCHLPHEREALAPRPDAVLV
jgi:hypothetical protein